MLAYLADKSTINESGTSFPVNSEGAKMVSRMRLLLAVSILLAVFVDSAGLSAVNILAWFVFFGYLLHSIIIYVCYLFNESFYQGLLIHWLDVVWFALIVVFTGRADSFFFTLFFFSILTSSFCWGFEEGARVTIASAALFAACGLLLENKDDFSRLLLRTTFLLTLGYMSAHWGESKVRLMRQLALLRDVSLLSNPRFGIDHTITSVLKKTRIFFKADGCILVMQNKESGVYYLRTINACAAEQSMNPDIISAQAASPLMSFLQSHVIVYARSLHPAMSAIFKEYLAYDCKQGQWTILERQAGNNLAELLGVRSFISAPVSLKRQAGRIYVTSTENSFKKADALFLKHIVEQAFPVIETIEVLDRMASEAALQERNKISLDIHDTAIQPYIGLKLGLNALLNKSSADNPLIEDINKLKQMAEKVISDLRHYAVSYKAVSGKMEPLLLVILNQQAARIKEFYGVDVVIDMAGNLYVNDRLALEVLQLVREGVSNICKHTFSQTGWVRLQSTGRLLKIQIENRAGIPALDFMPKSISERVAGLGGKVSVRQEPMGHTVVYIEIPI